MCFGVRPALVVGVILGVGSFAWAGDPPIVLDGNMIRDRASHFLKEQETWGVGVRGVLDQLEGVELIRKKMGLSIRVKMTQSVDFEWKKADAAKRFEPYRVRVPKEWSFRVVSREGQIRIKGLDSLKIYANVPVLSDLVTIDQVRVDLTQSLAVLWASVIQGRVRFSMGFSWQEDSDSTRMLMRWWESLRLNLPIPVTPRS